VPHTGLIIAAARNQLNMPDQLFFSWPGIDATVPLQ